MKTFHGKSVVLGLLIGIIGCWMILGVSATPLLGKIKSATYNNTRVYFYGKEIPLESSLVKIVKDENSKEELYMPMREVLEYMQYNVEWNSEDNSVNVSEHKTPSHYIKDNDEVRENEVVINLKNQNSNNIAESSSFEVKDKKILTLSILSDIKGGSVDLFLFSPNGDEKRITINSEKTTIEMELTQGLWGYNCSGIFKDGGTIQIIGNMSNK